MPNKSIIAIILLLVIVLPLKAQTWNKDYLTPIPSRESFCYDYNESNGGLICFSTLDNSGYPTVSDYYLIRINNYGDTLWTKFNYLNATGRQAIPNAIAKLSNGDYIIGTCQIPPDYDDQNNISVFYRIDSDGNILHTITKGSDIDAGQDINVMRADNNGYYLAYSYDSFYNAYSTALSIKAESIIEKYDSNNVLIWNKIFSTTYINNGDISYPYVQINTAHVIDDGIDYITRNYIGKLNADGSTGFQYLLTSIFPQFDDDYYMFCTSDTGIIVSIYDTTGHLCKFNSSGSLVHQIDMNDSFYFGNGTETSSGKYLMTYPTLKGFYLYDKNFIFIDSISYPFMQNDYSTVPLISNPYGGAFCAFLAGTGSGYMFGINFDSLFNNYKDLQISMHGGCFVPGFTTHLYLSLFNNGTVTIDTTAMVILDSNTYFISSSPTPISISGDTLVYSIHSLHPDSTDSININTITDSTIGLGVLLKFIALSAYHNNIGLSDDTAVYYGTTISSLDPNFKAVNRTYYFTTDQSLIYSIDFKNTGNDYASNIVIFDTIDNNLDPSSFQLIGGTPQRPITTWLANNIVKFDFINVNLPDSTVDPEGSYGQVIYSIAVKNNAKMGDTINNTASIFFDYNAPVVTNTTTNVISNINAPISDTINTQQNQNGIYIFPNPFSDVITINLPNTNSSWNISFYDVFGNRVINNNYNSNVINLNSELQCGFYIMKIINISNHETFIKKMIRVD